MSKFDSKELVEKFLANGGEITKLPAMGKTTGEKNFRQAAKAYKEQVESRREQEA